MGQSHKLVVTVDRDITDDFVRDMSLGVAIMGGSVVTRKCEVTKVNDREFKIILKQGLNRQIRRMCDTLGYTAIGIKRIRVMNLELGNMGIGKYRNITKAERAELYEKLNL